jgi:hypothetical protein
VTQASATSENTIDLGLPTWNSSRTDLDYWYGVHQLTQELGASTKFEDPETVSQKLRNLFRAAAEEGFEDGMQTRFSRGLVRLVTLEGEKALDRLAPLLTDYLLNEEVAAEAIRWLARIEDDGLYTKRLWLVERCLYSDSVRIRDAALLAVASLDDPAALPYLRGAISLERHNEIKRDMEDVEKQLTDTLRCA